MPLEYWCYKCALLLKTRSLLWHIKSHPLSMQSQSTPHFPGPTVRIIDRASMEMSSLQVLDEVQAWWLDKENWKTQYNFSIALHVVLDTALRQPMAAEYFFFFFFFPVPFSTSSLSSKTGSVFIYPRLPQTLNPCTLPSSLWLQALKTCFYRVLGLFPLHGIQCMCKGYGSMVPGPVSSYLSWGCHPL